MEVILLKTCALGNIGDVVNVKSGFGRNKLIPCGDAQRATTENKKIFESKRKELELANQELLNKAEEIRIQLGDASISLMREASGDMKLYGAISKNDIAIALKAKYGVEIDSNAIIINKKIKEVGLHTDINISLHRDISIPLELNVLPQDNK